MKVLPQLEHRFKSGKSPEEIYSILKSVTNSKKFAFSYPAHTEFIGEIKPSAFRIVSVHKWYTHDRCRPMIYGNITAKKGISIVNIKVRIEPFSRIGLTIFFGMTGLLFLFGIFSVFVSGLKGVMISIILCGGIIYGQVMVKGAFYTPAKELIRRLEELLI